MNRFCSSRLARNAALTGTLALTTAVAWAASPEEAVQFELRQKEFLWVIAFAASVLVAVMLVLLFAVFAMLDTYAKVRFGQSFFPDARWPKFLDVSWLWGVRPGGKKQVVDTPLDHNYDGIVELDNGAPPLFNYILYGTIGFAVIYLIVYHILGALPLQQAEYQDNLATAEASWSKSKGGAGEKANEVDETNVTALTDASAVSSGAEIYTGKCAACHGDKGQGLVGPNLTDEFWIHGGGIQNVFKTIKFGVPAKGMIAWKSQLNAEQMQQVASYILTLEGTKPAGAKAAEGEKWSPDAAQAPADSAKAENPAPPKAG